MANPAPQTLYYKIGGEQAVRDLVNIFYDLVETEAIGQPLLEMHNNGHGIAHTREAQFEFLSGFLGGPQLYFEHHRNSNVRTVHAHLKIGTRERDSWLACMDKALGNIHAPPELHSLLMAHFARIAEALRTAA